MVNLIDDQTATFHGPAAMHEVHALWSAGMLVRSMVRSARLREADLSLYPNPSGKNEERQDAMTWLVLRLRDELRRSNVADSTDKFRDLVLVVQSSKVPKLNLYTTTDRTLVSIIIRAKYGEVHSLIMVEQ